MFAAVGRLTRYFDWLNGLLVAILACIGLLFVFSATHGAEHHFSLSFKKQLFGIASGALIYATCALLDYRVLARYGYFAYLVVIGLLIFTLVKGAVGMGAQRWLSLFFFRWQPSELAKLLFPAFVAHYMYTHDRAVYRLRELAIPLVILLLSFVLILRQPDLGTALVILFSGGAMLWLAGLSRRFIFLTLVVTATAMPLMWCGMLRQYQKDRVLAFMGYGQVYRERYQTEQSMIAVGSGGILGKGLLRGTQNKFKFLPESRTDFIFAVLCEEWGFVGAFVVILLYLALFLRLFSLVALVKPLHTQLLALGLIMPLATSAFVNIAMVLGLLPVVGVPLPLMSYGISNLWVSMASLGWLQGISAQQLASGSAVVGFSTSR